jgi:hypothetical protein
MPTSQQSFLRPALHCYARFLLIVPVLFCWLPARAATAAAASQPDVLVFANGDQLAGQLERVTTGTVVFNATEAGKLQLPWAKIKTLCTDQPFAILLLKEKVRHGHHNAQVPQGSFCMANQQITIHATGGDQTIPVADIAHVIDAATYKTAVQHTPNLLHGWTGTLTGGASIVQSTQKETTYNSAVALARAIPTVAWIPADYRTLIGFTSSYGKITQTGTPTVKTSIFHANAEQDKYFSARFYTLGQAIFDHNYAQGLDLQQMYGGGFGYTAIKNIRQELDVNSTVNYTKQEFSISSSNLNLVGSTFANTYQLKLLHSILFTEAASITPEWNNMNAYSANASGGLTLPAFKRLAFSVQVIDSYLNNPPAGFQANSLQINTGLTYTLP